MVNTFIHLSFVHLIVTERSADMELFLLSLEHTHIPFYKYSLNIAFKRVRV